MTAGSSSKSEAEGEWTRVKSRSRYRQAPRNVPITTKVAPTPATSVHPDNLPCPAPKPVAEIETEYETFKSRWCDSGSRERVKDLVSSNRASCRPIRKAVCLGLGTFDPDHGGWDAKRRTYVQLVVFLNIVEQLSADSTDSISCLFQEPRFTASDKAFVESLGHTVVETPAAFEAVDEHTLLFAIHMYRPIYEAALAKTLPAMFAGTGWETWDDVGNLDDGEFQCMRDIHASHKLFEFPQDGTFTTFSSTVLYWRPRCPAGPKASSSIHQSPSATTEDSTVTLDEMKKEHQGKQPVTSDTGSDGTCTTSVDGNPKTTTSTSSDSPHG